MHTKLQIIDEALDFIANFLHTKLYPNAKLSIRVSGKNHVHYSANLAKVLNNGLNRLIFKLTLTAKYKGISNPNLLNDNITFGLTFDLGLPS